MIAAAQKPVVFEPLQFHEVHSENIQLFSNGRLARRVESFCKGICFSRRPVAVGEKIRLRITEVRLSSLLDLRNKKKVIE